MSHSSLSRKSGTAIERGKCLSASHDIADEVHAAIVFGGERSIAPPLLEPT
jgi:hypothetical protein